MGGGLTPDYAVYKYLAPNKKILSFEANSLPLLPGVYPNKFGENLEWGTFIKLFEYQMTGLKTNILFDLYNRFSLLMPTIALPVRMYERRKGYTGHSFETTLSGLSVRLEEDRRDNLEDNFPTSISFTAKGQEMKGLIYAFKKGQSEKYIKDEGIVFTVNGQTHGYFSNSFFSKKAVGMGYIANSILVTIDCTNIEGRPREDLFMNSRDRLRSGELRSEIEKNLTEILKNNPGLKELREKRRRELIEDKLKDSRPLAEIVEEILKKSPTLSKLFISGTRLSNPFKTKNSSTTEDYQGKMFPKIFKLIKKFPTSQPKSCPVNRKFRLFYNTDAVNDYLDRDSEPGHFNLNLNGTKIDHHINLWNGIGTLTGKLPDEAKIGDLIEFKSKISDPRRIDPFEESFYIKVDKAVKKSRSKGGGKRRAPSSNNDGDNGQRQSGLNLPYIHEIKRENWDEHGFNEKSALKVVSIGEIGYDFWVNMDNIYLLTEIKGEHDLDEKLLLARYKFALVLIGLALLKKHSEEKKDDDETEEIDIYSEIQSVTSALSSVILPMISSLGDLELEDESDNNE